MSGFGIALIVCLLVLIYAVYKEMCCIPGYQDAVHRDLGCLILLVLFFGPIVLLCIFL